MVSSFLSPSSSTKEGQLASLHLSHNSSLPVILSTTASNAEEEGYAEGVVTNTKFGSFPHSTLLNVPWGSQIRASKVDTGSRGRNPNYGAKKRKADAISTDSPVATEGSSPGGSLVNPTLAASGYIHVLPPTPENWTTSLPHRTQVVYTPDYSYILHRIRARPGSVLIEAGSGSGSFTHAAARAVYAGSPRQAGVDAQTVAETIISDTAKDTVGKTTSHSKQGKVYSFEFHPERHEKVKVEMQQHSLDHLVTATHRDVYQDGFSLRNTDGFIENPMANAVFLDLPAPWEALPHLTRQGKDGEPSVLDPASPVHICTFSPCIEQVQRTVSAMRRLGWVDIEMVELQHKRIDVRREFTGLKYDGMRGVNAFAVDVDEAISKLKAVEQRAQVFHAASAGDELPMTKGKVTAMNAQLEAPKLFYKEGIIAHRTEPEIKTHTSYLVFAILPQEWTDEDEEQAKQMLQSNIKAAPTAPKSQRQLKKEAKLRKRLTNGTTKATEQEGSSIK